MSLVTTTSKGGSGTQGGSTKAGSGGGTETSLSTVGGASPSTSVDANRSNSTVDLSKATIDSGLNRNDLRNTIAVPSAGSRAELPLQSTTAQANLTGSADRLDNVTKGPPPAEQPVEKSGSGEQQAQGQDSKKELSGREEDLKKREVDVERRAAELRNLEAMLKNVSETLAEMSKAQNAADEEKTSKLTSKLQGLFTGIQAFLKAFAGRDMPDEGGASKKQKPQTAEGEPKKEEATKTTEPKKTEAGAKKEEEIKTKADVETEIEKKKADEKEKEQEEAEKRRSST